MNPNLIPGLEPLESRIAPAVIFAGNPSADDTEYADAPFVKGTDGTDQIAKVLDPTTSDPDTFFIRLLPGDVLFKYDNAYTPFITGPSGTPLKGSVVAFFVDKAHGAVPKNGEMDADELTGMALGKDVSVQVSGAVNGDVVSNYNDVTKTLGGAAEAGGASATDLLLNGITLFQATSVTGKIIAGGDIKGIQLTNEVDQILTGLAANGVTYDFNSAAKADGGDTLVVTALPGAKGINISNVAAGGVTKIEAGAGGAGAIGGAVTNVTLVSDTNGLMIKSGNGGDGTAAKTTGGPGGKLSGILINGLDENVTDPSANSLITLQSGAGGKGFGAGKGGMGGEVSATSVGYEIKGGQLIPSVNPLLDRVLVQASDGGDGAAGGPGGKLSGVNVLAAPTGAGNNIDIKSGNGGKSLVAGGTAGAGGALLGSVVQNSNVLGQASFINIDAGDGGTTMGGVGKGNNGGMVDGMTLVGFSLKVNSGAGSSGSTGAGFGGDVKNIVISDGFVSVLPQTVIVDAGGGGSASAGKGNKGGMIAGLTVLNADLNQLDINQTAGSANGGTSSKGVGGAGGLVRDLSINDLDGANEVTIKLRGGDGGTGGGGGAGGAFLGANLIFAFDASLVVQGGMGGNATVKGNGGLGGGVSNLAFMTFGTVAAMDASATVNTGVGGNGNGAGAGGAGGTASEVDLRTPGAINVTAMKGGSGGATGGVGPGGAIKDMFGRSLLSSINLVAGDAGAAGVKAGAGGAVMVAQLRAATTISVKAGAGNFGGAGGVVQDVGFSDPTGTGAPGMAVSLTAGAGSGGGKAAGVGGNVTGATGFIGATGINQFIAGVGGGVAAKAAAGGSVLDMNIKGGGGAGAELRIEAGDAADVAGAKVGAVGGSVKNVAVDTLVAGTIFRRIAAGAGGDTALAGGTGGLGGTVDNVQVNYDIGVRRGEGFGYNTMGGIFAGAGGAGPLKNGLTGNVTNISADAIASIVAGKPVTGDAITVGNLVQLVDGIYLNGNVATIVDNNGTYNDANFNIANLVGGVVNPTAAGAAYPAAHPHANTFDLANMEFGDHVGGVVGEFDLGDTITANTDGFVASVIFNTANSNVSPEAIFMTDPADGLVKFFDLNNLNGQTIVP